MARDAVFVVVGETTNGNPGTCGALLLTAGTQFTLKGNGQSSQLGQVGSVRLFTSMSSRRNALSQSPRALAIKGSQPSRLPLLARCSMLFAAADRDVAPMLALQPEMACAADATITTSVASRA